jgi:4-carboxymuconolactone decarboxylase
MARVTELRTKEQLPPEFHPAFDEVVAVYRGRVVGPFRAFFYSPELARRVSNIGASLRTASSLPGNARELAIIAAAREWDCEYEWFAHEPGAERTGVCKETIDTVRNNKSLTGLPEEDAQVVQYVRDLLRLKRVPQALFNQVLARFGTQATVELTSTIGFYWIFACVMNAFEVAADKPIDFPVHPRKSYPRVETSEMRSYNGPSARIPLATSRADLSKEQLSVYDEIAGSRGGRVGGPFQVLLHSPEVARRAAIAGSYVRYQSVLPADVRELAIITAARANDCAYEWAAHETFARNAGVREQAIVAVKGGGGLADLPMVEAQVIGFIRDLLQTNRVSEDAFQAAMTRFGVQGLVELAATAGYYGMLACVLNAFEVQPV